MYRVKICGITTVDDALAAHEAGADAIGLVFHPPSKRYVDAQKAADIARVCPAGLVRVGLFVNSDADAVRRAYDTVCFDLVQLHGDESPADLAAIREAIDRQGESQGTSVPICKAFPCRDAADLDRVRVYLDQCPAAGRVPDLVMLDAAASGQYGGTGTACDWEVAARYHQIADAPPLVLAGGLTAENVAAAIAAVHPAAVDVSSGVESSPGRKDPERMRAFVAAAYRRPGDVE